MLGYRGLHPEIVVVGHLDVDDAAGVVAAGFYILDGAAKSGHDASGNPHLAPFINMGMGDELYFHVVGEMTYGLLKEHHAVVVDDGVFAPGLFHRPVNPPE